MTDNTDDKNLRYCYRYPHPAVTTDCAIFGFDGTRLKVLLIQRGIEPYKGCWALPGGFLNMDESAEEGAKRELYEETGMQNAYIRQLGAFTTPDRDPRERVITIAFYALVRLQDVRGGDDAADAGWFALDEIPALAFDHDRILASALQELRRQACFGHIGYGLLPEEFTMREYRNLYEAIYGTRYDSRSFRNIVKRMGILEPSATDASGKCRKYRFNKEKYGEAALPLLYGFSDIAQVLGGNSEV